MEAVRLVSREEVLSTLPHGEEHVCIDYVNVYDNYCIAYRQYTASCKEIEGHFPDYKVVPGHWLVEAMLQSSVFCPVSYNKDVTAVSSRVLSLKRCDFVSEVAPTDLVSFTVRVLTAVGEICTYSCVGMCNSIIVCRAEFIVK